MTAVAPGGALYEGPPRPRALLPALGPLGPVVRPVRPVLAPVLRAALPAHLRNRPFLPPKPRTPPHEPPPGALRDHARGARPLRAPEPPVPPVAIAPALPVLLAPAPGLVRQPGGPSPALGESLVEPSAEPLAESPLTAPARRRLLVAGSVVVAVVATAVAVLLSPVGAVRGVEVRGAGPRWEAAVRAATLPELGGRALLVDAGAVAARVTAVPGVRATSVDVRWPGTLVVEVTERRPAAAVPVDGGVRLFDELGVDLGVVATAPGDVLRVVAGAGPGVVAADGVEGRGIAAALGARAQLPAALAAEVVHLGATSADGVWFVLRDGATVVWGAADRAADKAAVLAALRAVTPQAARYDVSAPDAPAVTAG